MDKQAKDFEKGWEEHKANKKHEQEEMIGIIQGAVGGCARNWASLIAEAIYNAGYRKIPKGAVVLTECESFGDIEDLLTEFDEIGFEPTALHPYSDAYANNWKLRLAWAIGQLRKETEDKFAEQVDKWKRKAIFYYGLAKEGCSFCVGDDDEIAKEITENKV